MFSLLRPACQPCFALWKSTERLTGTEAMLEIRRSRRSSVKSDAHDTILVQINPRERADMPRSATEIFSIGFNEISFNSPLMKELRMIAPVAPGGGSRHR